MSENTYEVTDTGSSFEIGNDESFMSDDSNITGTEEEQLEETPVEEQSQITEETIDYGEEVDTEGDSEDKYDWLPENFNTPEDLLKSYKELQGEFTKMRQEMASQKYAEKSATALKVDENKGKQQEDQTTQQQAKEGRSLEFDSAFDELYEAGSISDSTYQRYQQMGIPPGQLDSIMQGKQAQITQMQHSIYDTAGGKESYEQLISWASENLTSDDKKVFNEAIKAGQDFAKFAVKALTLRRAEAEGIEPSLVSSNTTKRTQQGLKGFANDAEMLKAMQNPKYDSDPEYRKQVEKRLAKSTFQSNY